MKCGSRTLAVLLGGLLVALGACRALGGGGDEGQWQAHELNAPSENVLWTVVGMSLQKSGFPIGTGADPTTLTMTSGWKTSLAPFRGDGWREQASVKCASIGPGRWRVEVRVAREANMDIKHPMDPAYADWKEQPDDIEAANLIAQRIKAMLDGTLPAQTPAKTR